MDSECNYPVNRAAFDSLKRRLYAQGRVAHDSRAQAVPLAVGLANGGLSTRTRDMTDEQEIGAIIDEMYAMISGPAGPRDWSRQANCFLPDARQVRTSIDEHGRPVMTSMTLAEYARDTTPFFAANDFHEIETSRRIDLFGNIAHVWSGYEARTSPHDAERRGINSIQLFRHADHGWRIIHMIWD